MRVISSFTGNWENDAVCFLIVCALTNPQIHARLIALELCIVLYDLIFRNRRRNSTSKRDILLAEEMKFLFGNLIDTFNGCFYKSEEDRWNVLVMIGFTILTIGEATKEESRKTNEVSILFDHFGSLDHLSFQRAFSTFFSERAFHLSISSSGVVTTNTIFWRRKSGWKFTWDIMNERWNILAIEKGMTNDESTVVMKMIIDCNKSVGSFSCARLRGRKKKWKIWRRKHWWCC